MHHAGLPDWIAADEDDYVAKAVAFASDLEHLAKLRAGLRQQVLASPLFDAPRFARNFEEALWGMWQARTPTNIANAADPLAVLRD
jgi:protein O-GlcNAc transferase